MSHKVIISLGSNKGNRLEFLAKACELISQQLGEIISKAPVYESESWGYTDEAYLNTLVCVTTNKQPLVVLDVLLKIEAKLGRVRSEEGEPYSARTIDLDIVLIEGLCVDHPKLKVPHPRMHLRKFVLQPMVDIAPSWLHESMELSMSDLLLSCNDSSEITRFKGDDF